MMLQHWVVILAFAAAAAVLLTVLVMGPPSHPNVHTALFVTAMAGLGFSVMALQVAEYRATHPALETLGPVRASNDETLRSPNALWPTRRGTEASAPQSPYIAKVRQQP